MIEIYTDGSLKLNVNEPIREEEVCAGVGIILKYIDDAYKEIVKEEFWSYRYTYPLLQEELDNEDGFFECFDSITSTLIECIGFLEGFKLIKSSLLNNPNERVVFYVDDVFIGKTFLHYKEALNDYDSVTESDYYGCYMCMMHKIFNGDTNLLKRITVEHVDAHRDNADNNQADYLASYSANPRERVLRSLVKYTDLSTIENKKVYFESIQHLLNNNFEL